VRAVRCSECEEILAELPDDSPAGAAPPCWRCGATARTISVELHDEIRATDSLMVRARSRLFFPWARIAIRNEAAAWATRREGEAALQQDRATYLGPFLDREQDAAMVAICASAFGLDAFYGDLGELQPVSSQLRETWRTKRTPRHGRLVETLKSGFALGRGQANWPKRFEWLFDLRDGAVHFVGQFGELAPHPLGTRISPDVVSYSAENATEAVSLLMEVLRTTASNPKPPTTEFAAEVASLVPLLEELRQDGT
jgi:hypothetical protein